MQNATCVQAARAASSAAAAVLQLQQESREPLAAFGSGIEFRPTKKAKQQGSSQGPQKSAALPNLALDDDIDDDGGGNDVAMQPLSKPALVSFEHTCCQDCFYMDHWCFCNHSLYVESRTWQECWSDLHFTVKSHELGAAIRPQYLLK